MEALRNEVKELKNTLNWVTDDLIKLKALVQTMLKSQQIQQENDFVTDILPDTTYKKRKIVDVANPSPILSGSSAFNPESMVEAIPVVPTEFSTTSDGTIDNFELPSVMAMPPPPPPERLANRNQSTATTASLDQDVLASIFALDPSDDLSVFDSRAPSTLMSGEYLDVDSNAAHMENVLDNDLVIKVSDALAKLPPEMRVMFVDRMVSVIGNPEGFAKQVDAVTRIATGAANEAQRRLVAAGHSANDKHFLPLASAVLGAYLQRYLEQAAYSSISTLPTPSDSVNGDDADSSLYHSFPASLEELPMTNL